MNNDVYNAAAISRGLGTGLIGLRVFFHESLPSTMDAALDLALSGVEEGAVVVAGRQTGARGRLRRSWQSPPGNIALSVLLYPDTAMLPYMVMLAALAALRAIRNVAGLEAGLKWPNDVLINGKKVCGILAESRVAGGRRCAVIGIGVNVDIDLAAYPDIAAAATGLKQAAGHDLARLDIARGLLKQLDGLYALLPGGAGRIFADWRAALETLGKRVNVISATETIEGTAEDVAENGALLLRLEGGELREIVAGDVRLREA